MRRACSGLAAYGVLAVADPPPNPCLNQSINRSMAVFFFQCRSVPPGKPPRPPPLCHVNERLLWPLLRIMNRARGSSAAQLQVHQCHRLPPALLGGARVRHTNSSPNFTSLLACCDLISPSQRHRPASAGFDNPSPFQRGFHWGALHGLETNPPLVRSRRKRRSALSPFNGVSGWASAGANDEELRARMFRGGLASARFMPVQRLRRVGSCS